VNSSSQGRSMMKKRMGEPLYSDKYGGKTTIYKPPLTKKQHRYPLGKPKC
jgi:hypothetical protein